MCIMLFDLVAICCGEVVTCVCLWHGLIFGFNSRFVTWFLLLLYYILIWFSIMGHLFDWFGCMSDVGFVVGWLIYLLVVSHLIVHLSSFCFVFVFNLVRIASSIDLLWYFDSSLRLFLLSLTVSLLLILLIDCCLLFGCYSFIDCSSLCWLLCLIA